MLADTFVAYCIFDKRVVAAKKLVLGLSEACAGFHQVYCLDGFREWREIANGLLVALA